MKTKIKLISVIVFIATHCSSFGQLQKANQYFDLFQFAEAIPLYQKIIKNGSEKNRNEAIVRIADCYRLINNPLEARSWYARAVENPENLPINYLYLGNSQCKLENYADAKKSFEKYSQLVPDDPKGKLYAGFCDWAIENKNVVSGIMEIKNMKSMNTQWSDFCPVFYKNGIVFTSDRILNYKTDLPFNWTSNDYLDLYFCSPKYYQDFWTEMTEPKLMAEQYEQIYHDGPIVFSKDGTKVIISRTDRKKVTTTKDHFKTHMVKLFYADIKTGEEPKFKSFFLNSDEYSVTHPTLSPDARTMIFSCDKPGGEGESDLYSCEWINDSWSEPENLGSLINTIANEMFPTMVNDTILVFASDGHLGYGGMDLFISYKKNNEWTEPKNMMKPINSSYDDFGILLFDDLETGYFCSNRLGGEGLDDIYAFRNFEIARPAEKIEEEINPAVAIGYVKDKITLQPITQATVFLLNPQNGKVKIMKTNSDGMFTSTIDRPAEYMLKVMQKNYIADCLPWNVDKVEPNGTLNAPRDLLLDKLDLNKTFVLKNIYYDLDKYDIRDDAKPDLDNVIKIMQENPTIIAEISSHTDSRAIAEYNSILSQKRANAAVDYIVLKGAIMPGRMLARGYGESKLTNNCKDGVPCTEEQHQMNRRTEFKVIGYSAPMTTGQFDPARFRDGEIVDLKWLPDYFFQPCNLQVSESPKSVTTPVKDDVTVKKNVVLIKKVDVSTEKLGVPVKEEISTKKVELVTQKPDIAPQDTVKHDFPQYHDIVYGETLFSLAIRYNTTVERLMELNNLKNYTIIAGNKLRLY